MAMRLSQTAMAKALGISQPAVAKAVKKGMPLDSVEAALLWRSNRPDARPSKAIAVPTANETKPPVEPPPRPATSDSPEIADAKELCRLAYQDAVNTQDTRERSIAIQAYQRACEGLTTLIRETEAQAIASGALLPSDHVREVISTGCGQLRSLIENLPANVAAAANPSDPELAEAAVSDAIEQILATISNDSLFALHN